MIGNMKINMNYEKNKNDEPLNLLQGIGAIELKERGNGFKLRLSHVQLFRQSSEIRSDRLKKYTKEIKSKKVYREL